MQAGVVRPDLLMEKRMKKYALMIPAALCASITLAGSGVDQFNELGYGTLSGRIQTLSMYREYQGGNNNQATTLGLKLDYLSPAKGGWTVGASYIGVGAIDSMYNEPSPGDRLLGNGRVNVLNEAYIKYSMGELGWTNTFATVGRRVNVGEVFRADDFRQKPRAIEAVMVESCELKTTRILVGHAWEMSNWLDTEPLWKFENFDNYDTDGITWGEVVNTSVSNLEVAVYDAYAQDIANLAGARSRYTLSKDTALLGYLRHEQDVGASSGHDATAIGLSIEQTVEGITFEGGYFGVGGDNLFFQELTTGINHALGSSMMIYSGQFNGGADTLYAKVSTKVEKTNTGLYCLYNYTMHDTGKSNWRQAQELNIVVKQPVPKIDNLTVAFKGGVGTRDGIDGNADTTATDARLFVTYAF